MSETGILFHGTSSGAITRFDPGMTADGGIHFGSLAQAMHRWQGPDRHIVAAKLRVDSFRLRRSRDTGKSWARRISDARLDWCDGIVYLNRWEGMTTETVARLAASGDLSRLDRVTDAEFRRLVPESTDSYIVWDPDRIVVVDWDFRPPATAKPRP